MHQENTKIDSTILAKVSRQAASEGIVLLENKESILPIKAGETISLFGRCQIDTYRSGTGSGGAVNVKYAINALEGLRANRTIKLNESLVGIYEQWVKSHPFDNGGGGWAAEPWFQHEMPLTDELVNQAAKVSNKAVVFIGRTAGEEQDNREEAGSYYLTELELEMLGKVATHFKDVIVVLNVSNIIDMSWLSSLDNNQSIKAVLYNWAAGMEGGHALADVLSGDVSPSGRLTDTIAHNLADYPSSENFGRTDYNLYAEDIYLGYRYFETFKPQAVQYEFGAGLSYTAFSQKLVSYTVDGKGADSVLHFDIEVENVGTHFAGKEVVQIYLEAPQGELGKPARVLVGFSKSKALDCGESQAIRISIPVHSFASYDDSGVTGEQSCYVLEQGCYQFYFGGSVRKAQRMSVTFELDEMLVTERLKEALAPVTAFDRMKPGTRNSDGAYELAYEPVPQRTVSMLDRIETELPACLELTGDKGIKLIDVKQGRAGLEEFIAQLTPEQLATMTRGEGMCSPKVTPGVAAAFGGVSQDLYELGIPVAAAADGPSGIRMDSGHTATQVPIGTLLASTWNRELNEQLFYLVGQELVEHKIDTLLGPGMNIHRHPLNGRNFEYFSEDSLITGVIASAQTRGLSRAGVSGTIKHFVANDQETARKDVDSIVSERALREIHLKPFEMAVKEGRASTIMTAYNPVNGHWTASNYDLNTTILRGEWGYTGIVMSDWWAKMNDPVTAGHEDVSFTSFMIRSQNDLYMVVENDGAECNASEDDTLAALQAGTLTLGELQRSAMNICRFIMNAPVMNRPLEFYHNVKHFEPLQDVDESLATPVEKGVSFKPKSMKSAIIEVTHDGLYQCDALMRYELNSMAQSSCNLNINGVIAMTLPVNGTDGKLVTVKGQQVKLTKGCYELSVETVKPGLELEQLTFAKV
ncbi:glycoside hydrolase family 3 C-terminal domain-containing protein [Vibrio lamellibrachiae]|uniref:glycoside hydrolase family 3 protein n=1 Tax=Vibrio lamellibrachiae TaxID=2910253 RepID=UPI003D11683D